MVWAARSRACVPRRRKETVRQGLSDAQFGVIVMHEGKKAVRAASERRERFSFLTALAFNIIRIIIRLHSTKTITLQEEDHNLVYKRVISTCSGVRVLID